MFNVVIGEKIDILDILLPVGLSVGKKALFWADNRLDKGCGMICHTDSKWVRL